MAGASHFRNKERGDAVVSYDVSLPILCLSAQGTPHTTVRIVSLRVTLRSGCAFALPPLSPLGYNSISLAMMVTQHCGSLAREDK